MTQLESQANPDRRPGGYWGNRLAWFVILSLTVCTIVLGLQEETVSDNPATPPQIPAIDLSQLELQGKTLLLRPGSGLNTEPSSKVEAKEKKSTQPVVVPANLDEGTINQRWCVAVLKNELESPAQAIEYLALTKDRLAAAKLRLDKEQERVQQLLENSFRECEQATFGHAISTLTTLLC